MFKLDKLISKLFHTEQEHLKSANLRQGPMPPILLATAMTEKIL